MEPNQQPQPTEPANNILEHKNKMKPIETHDYSKLSRSFPEEVIQELKASAIDPDIIDLNFTAFDGIDENELDEVFTLLIPKPEHNNNGTLSGKSPNDLASVLRSGGWFFKGYKGVSVKPNAPREDNGGKVIKYESPRGAGNIQIFIPRVTWKTSTSIGWLEGSKRILPEGANLGDEDTGFWDWYLSTNLPLIATEGAKKACSIISNGCAAIGFNGIYGWGSNVKDNSGESVKNDKGFPVKQFHPDLIPFLNGREIILAFDRDNNVETIDKVCKAMISFYWELVKNSKTKTVTHLMWRDFKGIDDLLASTEDVVKREAAMGKLVTKRTDVRKLDAKTPIKKEIESNKAEKSEAVDKPRFRSSLEGGLEVLVELNTPDGKKEVFIRLGNHLQCIAYVNNPEGNGSGLQLEFKNIRGGIVNWTMNRGYLTSDTPLMLSEMMNRGYQFDLSMKKYLIEYLNSLGADVEKTYTIVDATGWVKGRYISQHKTYGEGDYVFQHVESNSETATEIKGNLEDWKTHIGAKCDNNSRLIFVLGVAFAAPLLDVVGLESGGFHLMGDTSTGKTTAIKVAISVIGEKEIPNWRTTGNGLEMTATAHNHALLALDEIGQADEKGVGESCYMLRNGQGKSRSTKDLKARKVKTWRLLFLSTGEHSLVSYMAMAGKVQKGGQEVGMPDIPAVPFGSPYDAFESIHGCESSKEFAENLEAACKKYRGSAIDEFLTRLVVDRQDKVFDGTIAERVFKAAKKLSEGTTDLAVSRVANRFALVQVALELAHSYDILPFGFDRIEWAVKKMFTDWLTQRGGDGSIEMKQAVKRIEHLLVTNEFSDRVMTLRFDNIKGLQLDDSTRTRNFLAYRKADKEGTTEEYWIPPSVFDEELCKGVNKTGLIKVLQGMRWLTPPASDGRPTVERRVGGKKTRFFVIIFQNIEKTMETVETLETVAENHSSNSFCNHPPVSIEKKALETVETARENEGYSDYLPDPEEVEEDADTLTEF